MQSGTLAGVNPRTESVASPVQKATDGGSGTCPICGVRDREGYDADLQLAVCRRCAQRDDVEPATDGGRDVEHQLVCERCGATSSAGEEPPAQCSAGSSRDPEHRWTAVDDDEVHQLATDGGTAAMPTADVETSGRCGRYLATYQNGSGFDTVRLTDYTTGENYIVARDVDGRRHVWTTGSSVHIKEVPTDE